VSGKDLKRPGFDRLQKAVFNGQVKCIVVWKLDRISRSVRDGINTLCDWIDQDVRVVAVTQQLDFAGKLGQIIAPLLFALAQMERENLRENTKRGIAVARSRTTKPWGRQPTLALRPSRLCSTLASRWRT
jgi:DNA invertase Pin-like site-specific DNA recombinase